VSGVDLVIVPYDCANREARMGRGPNALLRAGLVDRLAEAGVGAGVHEIESAADFSAEVAVAFEHHQSVAQAARTALPARRRPITLSGNCNTGVIGSLCASPGDHIGLIWFDAHSDAETPETSTSGFLDGMGLAMVLGRCWGPMLDSVGFSPLDGSRVALVAAREISGPARLLLEDCGVCIVPPEQARTEGITAAIEHLQRAGVARVHLHVDLDVLDPDEVGPANSYALPDGLGVEQLLAALHQATSAFQLESASLASYDPEVDRSGAVGRAGIEVVALLASAPHG
jgi:arginase